MKTNEEKKEIKFKSGELRDITLRILGISLVVGGSIVFPTLPIVLGSIVKLVEEFKKSKIPKSKIRRVLKKLEQRDIVSLAYKEDKVFVQIKDRNNVSVLKYSLKHILEFKKKEKIWKGKWYMVVFDVPEVQRNKRNHLRRFLTELGFYQYQQSVYIFPYECEKEIQLIRQILESNKYVNYIIAERIENEEKARTFFGLA